MENQSIMLLKRVLPFQLAELLLQGISLKLSREKKDFPLNALKYLHNFPQ